MINNKDKNGFTIVELMIAMTILSVILLMVALIMTNIGALYSKGVDLTNVQNVNRNLISELASSVEFSGQPMEGPNQVTDLTYSGIPIQVYAICFGSTRYSYTLGIPGSNNPIPHTVWKDEMSGVGSCEPLNVGQFTPVCEQANCLSSIPGSGGNLVSSNMHLATLRVSQYNSRLYAISIGLVYGQKGMFETIDGHLAQTSQGNYICNNQTGDQFCASSFLQTVADEKIN